MPVAATLNRDQDAAAAGSVPVLHRLTQKRRGDRAIVCAVTSRTV
jgi:hypothetical protein